MILPDMLRLTGYTRKHSPIEEDDIGAKGLLFDISKG